MIFRILSFHYRLCINMIYSFMRLLLFFDLPMHNKKEIKIYTQFRKYLIQNGYLMVQYSVYCKLFANREAAVKHVQILKRNIPAKGIVHVMLVTEKQYARMEILIGGKSVQEKLAGSKAFVKL